MDGAANAPELLHLLNTHLQALLQPAGFEVTGGHVLDELALRHLVDEAAILQVHGDFLSTILARGVDINTSLGTPAEQACQALCIKGLTVGRHEIVHTHDQRKGVLLESSPAQGTDHTRGALARP